MHFLPLPLGEVALRSNDEEGEPVFTLSGASRQLSQRESQD